jgi:hypothetical protein
LSEFIGAACVRALACFGALACIGTLVCNGTSAAAEAPASASARIEARSANLLVVGVVHDDAMTVHVSRLLDNAPVRDAVVAVTFRGATHPAAAQVDGGYALHAKELGLPGTTAVEFKVVEGGTEERIAGTLEVAGAAGQGDGKATARQLGWWVLNFAVCAGFLLLIARRKKRAEP